MYVLQGQLRKTLKPTVNSLIRPGKSTAYQIFTTCRILVKICEKSIDTHHFVVDFNDAYDSIIRSCLYIDLSEFGIPK